MDFKLIEKLVDMTLEIKECPKGYRWCNKAMKCVPKNKEMGMGQQMGKGGGKGPLGKTMTTREIFAADFPAEEKVEKIVDMILDNFDQEPNSLQNVPEKDDAEEQLKRLHQDLAGYDDDHSKSKEYQTNSNCDHGDEEKFNSPEEYEEHEKEEHGYESDEESEEHIKNDHPDMMNPAIYKRPNLSDYISNESKEEYQTFFKKMMDKEGINSIKDLSGEKKKEFFDKVDAEWKSDHEDKSIKESIKMELRSKIKEIKSKIKK